METVLRPPLFVLILLLFAAQAPAGAGINPHGRPIYTGPAGLEHYALWRDGNTWHLRTFSDRIPFRFRGTIEVRGGNFVKVKVYKHEHSGARVVPFSLASGRRIGSFDYVTQGSIDGVDFRVKGMDPVLSLTLEVGEGESKFESGRVFVGRSGVHPLSSPFELPAPSK